jgi:aspartate 1-decarboxylase
MENVHVWDITNGERFETLRSPIPRAPATWRSTGPPRARQTGDRVITASYAWLTRDEMKSHKPVVCPQTDAIA